MQILYYLLKDLVCVTMCEKEQAEIKKLISALRSLFVLLHYYILVLYNYIVGLCSSRTRTIFTLEELVWTLFLLVRKNVWS